MMADCNLSLELLPSLSSAKMPMWVIFAIRSRVATLRLCLDLPKVRRRLTGHPIVDIENVQ
jgi:hypothetical protein